jgi:hypothetical protein
VDAHTFTKQIENALTNADCRKADGNCFLEQERSADGGTHTSRNHNSQKSNEYETLKKTA